MDDDASIQASQFNKLACYFLLLPRQLRRALSRLRAFLHRRHSKCRDLSCHCSLLGDCIFGRRALWPFRTLENSKFIIASSFSSMGYYYLALPCYAAFSKYRGAWVITVSQFGADAWSVYYNKTSVRRK